MKTKPDIPPVYDLLVYESVDSAMQEARRLAMQGAEEGTLVWARNQTDSHGRLGGRWVSEPGNLYCAIIFRPDDPPAVATQLLYVTAVGLWSAMAACVSPLTELHYRWPNDILLLGDQVAGLTLALAPGQTDDWLVIGVSVNVVSHPEEIESAASNMALDGGSEASEIKLLELFSRHLLGWINRWAEEGFDPIRKAWMQHAHGVGEPIEVALKNDTVEGVFVELNVRGELVVELPDGVSREISIAEYYSIANAPATA